MYRINNSKTKILDHENRIVGYIKNEKFIQHSFADNLWCHSLYESGLTPGDMEKISELMQRNNLGMFR